MFSENNAVYLISAYGVFLGAMAVYGIVLVLRRAAAAREARLLDEAEQTQDSQTELE